MLRYEKAYKYLYSTKKCTIFVVFNEKIVKMETVLLTDAEFNLIMAIRNYGKSFPDGYPEIRWYIESKFVELLDEAETKGKWK